MLLWRVNKNEYVATIESPWFAAHMIRAICAGVVSWSLLSDENYWLGVPAVLWVIGELLTSVEVRDRRRAD